MRVRLKLDPRPFRRLRGARDDLVVAEGTAGLEGQTQRILDLGEQPAGAERKAGAKARGGPCSRTARGDYFASAASIVSRSSAASGVTLLLKNFTTLPSLSTTYFAKFQVGSEPVLPRCA